MVQKIGVILLAGGSGSRMNSSVPKQFLHLGEKPIAKYSLDLFLGMSEISQLVLVCAEQYRTLFQSTDPRLSFAPPGNRRQDSVYSGLQALSTPCNLVCVHDAARPFITAALVRRVIAAAQQHGAATLGMPLKCTVKQCCDQHFVTSTPDRAHMWEIQTPQVIQHNLLAEGFIHANKHSITVTDDVSLVELLQKPVQVVEGSYNNLKITTPEDLVISQHFLRQYSNGI